LKNVLGLTAIDVEASDNVPYRGTQGRLKHTPKLVPSLTVTVDATLD
jgi:hypothetical protein